MNSPVDAGLIREQILASPDANDQSPDWQDWSISKWERERKRIPEIDAILSRNEATFIRSLESSPLWNAMRLYARFSETRLKIPAFDNMVPPWIDEPTSEHEAAPEGEWTMPMSKTEMMTRLGLNPRAFDTFAKQFGIRKISRQQFQIRVDKMDAKTRRKIEVGRA